MLLWLPCCRLTCCSGTQGSCFHLKLPTDHPRNPPCGPPSQLVSFAPCGANIQRIAVEHRCTEFAVLLAVYGVLLGRQCHQKELVIGIPVSQRRETSKCDELGALGLLFRSWSPIVGCQPFYMPMYFFYVNSPEMSGKGLEDGGSTFNKHFALFKFVRQSSGCDEVIGCFVNTVPVRVTLMDSAGDRSFQSILGSAGRGKWEVKKQTGPSCCG